MRITMLRSGLINADAELNETLQNLLDSLKENHDLSIFDISELDIHHCTGCWTCWNRTPGICAFKDDMGSILESMVNSDLVLFASVPSVGFIDAKLKRTIDRMIPLVLPYIGVAQGELHHILRYEENPCYGMVILNQWKNEVDLLESKSYFKNYIERFSLNFNHGKESYAFLATGSNTKELINEINHI